MIVCRFLVLALGSTLGDPPGYDDRVAGWRGDIDFFVAEAQRAHAGPTRPAFSAAFGDAARELRAAVPELSDDEVLAGMMSLAALLGDGHTALYGPADDTPLVFERRVLPFKFYLFPDGLYVVDGVDDWVAYAGSRVISFGALTAEEVLDRMSTHRGVDNAMTWTWMGPQFYVRKLGLLQAVGVPIADGAVEMALLTLDGEEVTLSVPGGEHQLIRKLRPFRPDPDGPPLYLSDVGTNYWLQPLPEHDAVYFQFNQVRDAATEGIAAFADRLRTALIEEEASVLIVDVRHNNGGNNSLVRPLVRMLVEFEMRDPENRVFVLMGRNTFSAAQNFINRVESWTNATFAGEPSSSSPNFTGEENEIVLPFSRIRGSISNLYWQDSNPTDERPWIEPDIPVELTAADYFEGRDPVLERVLEEL